MQCVGACVCVVDLVFHMKVNLMDWYGSWLGLVRILLIAGFLVLVVKIQVVGLDFEAEGGVLAWERRRKMIEEVWQEVNELSF